MILHNADLSNSIIDMCLTSLDHRSLFSHWEIHQADLFIQRIRKRKMEE